MSTLRITDEDRARYQAEKGRSLADLLPTPPTIADPEPEINEADQEIEPKLPVATNRQLAGALAVSALVVLVAWIALRPGPSTDNRQPATTAAPAGVSLALPTEAPAATEATATMLAYAAPEGAQLGPIDASAPIAYRHSEYPQWGGVRWQGAVVWVRTSADQLDGLPDLARPTPEPTPKIIYIEPACSLDNPRYVAQIDVSDARGVPLGQATGRSCDSQAEAQQNALAHAAEMRAAAPAPCPTWPGPPFVKPDCGGN